MKTLVDLYPELFDVQASAFFENGKLSISPVVEATITQLDKKAKDYAMKTIVNPNDNPQAVEDCKNRYIDGACWYKTNVFKLKALGDEVTSGTGTVSHCLFQQGGHQVFDSSDNILGNRSF